MRRRPTVIATTTLNEVATSMTDLIARNAHILGGDPVFAGTRVLIRSLFEHLAVGDSLDRFLEQSPDVKRDRAIAVIEQAEKMLLETI